MCVFCFLEHLLICLYHTYNTCLYFAFFGIIFVLCTLEFIAYFITLHKSFLFPIYWNKNVWEFAAFLVLILCFYDWLIVRRYAVNPAQETCRVIPNNSCAVAGNGRFLVIACSTLCSIFFLIFMFCFWKCKNDVIKILRGLFWYNNRFEVVELAFFKKGIAEIYTCIVHLETTCTWHLKLFSPCRRKRGGTCRPSQQNTYI